MSTWEERMAARAAERRRADEQMHAELGQAAQQAEAQRAELEALEDFKAGPPDGCHQCYVWREIGLGFSSITFGPSGVVDSYSSPPSWSWVHVTISEGDQTCYHECHGGEPYPCGPVVIG